MTVAIVAAHGGLTNFEFDASKPFVGCKLCGRLFQSKYDRDPYSYVTADFAIDAVLHHARKLSRGWQITHNKSHPEHEHVALLKSGRWCTPEAAEILAPLGVIPLIDLVLDQEVNHAMRQAPRAPIVDAEDKLSVR